MTNVVTKAEEILAISKDRNLCHITYDGLIASTSVIRRYKGDPWLRNPTPINHWEKSAFITRRHSTDFIKCIDYYTDIVTKKRPRDNSIGMDLVFNQVRYYVDIETYMEDEKGNVVEQVDFKINTNHRAVLARWKNEELNRPYFRVKHIDNDKVFKKSDAPMAALTTIRSLIDLWNITSDKWSKDNATTRSRLLRDYTDNGTLQGMIHRAIQDLMMKTQNTPITGMIRRLPWIWLDFEQYAVERILILVDKKHEKRAHEEMLALCNLRNKTEDELLEILV